jgi:hypothetical protein
MPVDHDSSTHPRAKDNPENGFHPLGRAQCRLCQGTAIRIIGQYRLDTEDPGEIMC